VNAAFADPDIKALMAVIGGSDQITVLPHLDAEIITANPKAFLATRTTPTCSTTCGTSGSLAITEAPPWFISLGRAVYTRRL
jgi:hypothetical protein